MHDSPESQSSASVPEPVHSSLFQPPALWILLLFWGLVAAYWYVNFNWFYHMWREDLTVYGAAVQAWQAGTSPYGAALAPMYFLYPPFFLYLAGLFSHLIPAGWGATAYTVDHVVATVALPLVLGRYYFRQSWLSPLFVLLLFFASPRFMGVSALCGLNIASSLYCLAFIAAVPGLRKDRWGWFYCAVFVTAMIKITFLAFLLLPILASRRQFRQWVNCAICGAVVVGANLLEARLLPDLYSGYKWSLVQGIVHEGYYGFGVFGIVAAYGYKLHLPEPASAYAIALSLSIVMLGAMLLLRRRMDKAGGAARFGEYGSNGPWLALIVALIILVNPRELQYDADISLLAAFVLWVHGLRTRRVIPLMVVLFLPSIFVPMVIKAMHLYGMYGTIETLIAFGLVVWQLWRETESRPALTESPA